MDRLLLLADPSPSKADIAKSRLLQAALAVFGEHGFHGATVRDIAEAAGQNVAAISYYFGGKEELYHALLRAAGADLQHRMEDIIEELARCSAAGPPDPDRAIDLVKTFIAALFLRISSRKETLPVAQLIIREQMQPTSGFDVIYDSVLRRVHENLTCLVGIVLELPPDHPEAALRTHMLLGQTFAFGMARETILRRLGWDAIEGEQAALVASLIEENTEILLRGLRPQRQKGPS